MREKFDHVAMNTSYHWHTRRETRHCRCRCAELAVEALLQPRHTQQELLLVGSCHAVASKSLTYHQGLLHLLLGNPFQMTLLKSVLYFLALSNAKARRNVQFRSGWPFNGATFVF